MTWYEAQTNRPENHRHNDIKATNITYADEGDNSEVNIQITRRVVVFEHGLDQGCQTHFHHRGPHYYMSWFESQYCPLLGVLKHKEEEEER